MIADSFDCRFTVPAQQKYRSQAYISRIWTTAAQNCTQQVLSEEVRRVSHVYTALWSTEGFCHALRAVLLTAGLVVLEG